MTAQLWVLAEPDTFFLPHLLHRLASDGHVAGIIEIGFPRPFAARMRHLRRQLAAVGLINAVMAAVGSALAKVIAAVSPANVYSLARVARMHRIPFFRCQGFGDPVLRELLSQRIGDTPVFVQVGRLVPAEVVERHYLINKHCSLLPRYAGVLPVFWSLLAGETVQGVTIHRMNAKFDEGPILAQAQISTASDTVFGIYHRLYDVTYRLLSKLLRSGEGWAAGGTVPDLADHAYFTYPTGTDRQRFAAQGRRFGWPLRIHTQAVMDTEVGS